MFKVFINRNFIEISDYVLFYLLSEMLSSVALNLFRFYRTSLNITQSIDHICRQVQ